jgi:hypothetical protein
MVCILREIATNICTITVVGNYSSHSPICPVIQTMSFSGYGHTVV